MVQRYLLPPERLRRPRVVILEPPHLSGGVGEPRVAARAACQRSVMGATALGPPGPRRALAVWRDLVGWHHLGVAHYVPESGINPGAVFNK